MSSCLLFKAYCATIGGSFVMIESEDEQLFIEGVVETIYSGKALTPPPPLSYRLGGVLVERPPQVLSIPGRVIPKTVVMADLLGA